MVWLARRIEKARTAVEASMGYVEGHPGWECAALRGSGNVSHTLEFGDTGFRCEVTRSSNPIFGAALAPRKRIDSRSVS